MTTDIVQSIADLPWGQIGSLGAGGIALFMCGLFLREQRDMRKEHGETIKAVTAEHAKTTKEVTGEFSSTVKELAREHRESHERREESLHSLIRERRND